MCTVLFMRNAETVKLRKPPPYQPTVEERRAYHLNMARMCAERGFPGLAESHVIAANDPPEEM